MKWKILSVLALITFSLANAIENIGVESSGGTEDYVPNTAWFTDGNRQIRWCVLVDPDFGNTEEEVAAEVRMAFETWAKYLVTKRVFAGLSPKPFRQLNTKLASIEKCDGSQDLKFYFGVSDLNVEKNKIRFRNPFAFVQQTVPFDGHTGWSQGFVWVGSAKRVPENELPPAHRKYYVQTVLLHEIGHIMGCEHVEGTVMTPKLSNEISFNIPLFYGRIDWGREIATCPDCAIDYREADITWGGYKPGRRTFVDLVGSAPEGEWEAEFHTQSKTLTLKDGNGSYDFILNNRLLLTSMSSSNIFQMKTLGYQIIEGPDGKQIRGKDAWGMMSYFNQSLIYRATMQGKSGAVVPVLLVYNGSDIPLQNGMLIVREDTAETVFTGHTK